MATEIPRIYLDSCVYIELFVGSPGTARFDASAALLRSAIRGELRIVASEMVRVEVAHLGGVPSQGLRSIDEAFDSPAFLWIQLDRTIARAARAVVERGVLEACRRDPSLLGCHRKGRIPVHLGFASPQCQQRPCC